MFVPFDARVLRVTSWTNANPASRCPTLPLRGELPHSRASCLAHALRGASSRTYCRTSVRHRSPTLSAESAAPGSRTLHARSGTIASPPDHPRVLAAAIVFRTRTSHVNGDQDLPYAALLRLRIPTHPGRGQAGAVSPAEKPAQRNGIQGGAVPVEILNSPPCASGSSPS